MLFDGDLGDFSLGDSISSDPERAAPKKQEEESIYTEVCSKGQVV